jgi:uncharacterized protein (DUF433 family)
MNSEPLCTMNGLLSETGFDMSELLTYKFDTEEFLKIADLEAGCPIGVGGWMVDALRKLESEKSLLDPTSAEALQLERRMRSLKAAMTRPQPVVHSDPDILGGVPVFVGTRVPVWTLFDFVAAGDPLKEFLDQFPTVTREQAVAALGQAKELLMSTARAA